MSSENGDRISLIVHSPVFTCSSTDLYRALLQHVRPNKE